MMPLEAKHARIAGSHRELEETGRTLPRTLRGNAAPPTPGFRTSVPRTMRSNFCCVSALVRDPLLWSFVDTRPGPVAGLAPGTVGNAPANLTPRGQYLQAASDPESSSVCRSPSSDTLSGIIVSRIPRDFFELASR